jgi:hypothetical protein
MQGGVQYVEFLGVLETMHIPAASFSLHSELVDITKIKKGLSSALASFFSATTAFFLLKMQRASLSSGLKE